MGKQEEEDDADLKQLKDKLKYLADMKPPTDKDALIQHLIDRLHAAEQAINSSEEVITHERQNRKTISKELNEKNEVLRELVNKEKRKLQDKVHDELEITLKQALHEKMTAEAKLAESVAVMLERDMMI